MQDVADLLNQYNSPISKVTFVKQTYEADYSRAHVHLNAKFDFSRMEDVYFIMGEQKLLDYIRNSLLAQADRILKEFKEQLPEDLHCQ